MTSMDLNAGSRKNASFSHIHPWEIGYTILNRREIIDIKKGGMGIVYIIHDNEWDRLFAAKTFQDEFLRNDTVVQRFIHEADVWIQLERHTNIVYADFAEKIEGKPLLFLEYIENGDVSQFVGKLGIREFLDFAIQFCTEMEYAYKKLGVIHRDIKPENVLVKKDPRFISGYCFKISDFGLVKALGPEFDDRLISVSTGLGTILFMSPEQFPEKIQEIFSHHGTVTTRSDVYSFGVTLYELVTGQLPFEKIDQIFLKVPVHPRIINRAIPYKLDILIMRCLEKNPEKRYPDFTLLKEELIEIFNSLFLDRYIVIGKNEELTNIDWLNKGVALGSLGKYSEAMNFFDISLKINPLEPRAWADKGNALSYLSHTSEALQCFEKALQLDPEYGNAWCRKGITLAKVGKYPEAILCYDKALVVNPNDSEALSNKGMSLGALGKHEEALVCYEKAVAINPREPSILSHMGASMGNLGMHQEALKMFERALAINPREYMAWYGKGLALIDSRRGEEAIRCLEKFLDLLPVKDPSTIQQINQLISYIRERAGADGIVK